MDALDLEKLGLNRNEARVYYALIQKGEASASALVKVLGVHRNIVYDNLEKLIEKGLVSFIVKGTKRVFVAEEPNAILEFLDSKKQAVDEEVKSAKDMLPQISELLRQTSYEQDTTVFRGIKGVKKVLAEVLKEKENWCIGMSKSSVEVMGDTYWKNYNAKVDELGIKEHFLINHDFKDDYAFEKRENIFVRRLPKELTQITEINLYGGKVAIFVFSPNPIAIVIKDRFVFETFKMQFDFLWKLSK